MIKFVVEPRWTYSRVARTRPLRPTYNVMKSTRYVLIYFNII